MCGAGVGLEEAGDANGVLLLLLDADVHRLHSSEQQPRVEGAQTGALGVLEEVDLKKKTKTKWRHNKETDTSIKFVVLRVLKIFPGVTMTGAPTNIQV